MDEPKPWAVWCDGHGLEFHPNECGDETKEKHKLYKSDTICKAWEEFAKECDKIHEPHHRLIADAARQWAKEW